MPYRINTEVIGHVEETGRIDVTVRHDPSASYTRSVVPTAKRFFLAAGLARRQTGSWSCALSAITDTDTEGRCLTNVIFTVL